VMKQGPEPLRLIFCDQNPKQYAGADAWKAVRNFWTASFLTTEVGKEGTNPLTYPGAVGKPKVSAWMLTAGPVYRPHAFVDLGVSFGAMGFSGSTEKSTTKLMIDPYIVIRPLLLVKNVPAVQRVVEIRFGFAIFPQGFTLADFGATGGAPLNGGQELITTFGLSFNVARFFGWQ
jgi:hypothetical protein